MTQVFWMTNSTKNNNLFKELFFAELVIDIQKKIETMVISFLISNCVTLSNIIGPSVYHGSKGFVVKRICLFTRNVGGIRLEVTGMPRKQRNGWVGGGQAFLRVCFEQFLFLHKLSQRLEWFHLLKQFETLSNFYHINIIFSALYWLRAKNSSLWMW